MVSNGRNQVYLNSRPHLANLDPSASITFITLWYHKNRAREKKRHTTQTSMNKVVSQCFSLTVPR
ncbi:hypothetical protein BofuT4_P076280.1 [Botrytis cinerea T4]|uniref:Uncharacterized protein n=1 Tax=Botryotinia fuckeliana (strain T4) TaxID=999810 RepID=G2XNT9_BOTF4|nr:hypothetical protein BofuT4_P076280.1 [Botrytis cinerea T4]